MQKSLSKDKFEKSQIYSSKRYYGAHGVEPWTSRSAVECSTTELYPLEWESRSKKEYITPPCKPCMHVLHGQTSSRSGRSTYLSTQVDLITQYCECGSRKKIPLQMKPKLSSTIKLVCNCNACFDIEGKHDENQKKLFGIIRILCIWKLNIGCNIQLFHKHSCYH